MIDLWYWSGIPGRGEFVRLLLEAAGISYRDRARDDGDEALVADMKARTPPPFAPPYIAEGDGSIAQVAHILTILSDRYGLSAAGSATNLWLIQLQLTITDLVAEVHNVHHPVDAGAYYADQKAEAARAAQVFRDARLPKFLDYFEAAAAAHPGDWIGGDAWSHVDTSLFQLIEGLRYMFPQRMAALEPDYPGVIAIRNRVAALPGVAAYLASDRRLPFNQDGIFRHYPELDAA